MKYKRGSIYYFDFGYYRGSEQGGIRPAVIISNDIGNANGPVLIVAPITSRQKNRIPTHIHLDNYSFLDDDSIILMEQIITKDKMYIKEKLGELNDNDLFKLDYYAGISLQLYNCDSEFKKLINSKVNDLNELRGYINRHVYKFKETDSIQDDIEEYNQLFSQFKTFCIQHKFQYKYLYNETINV